MHPAIAILPQRIAYRPSYTAVAPPLPTLPVELPSPAILPLSRAPERILLCLLKLSDPSAPSFPHWNIATSDQSHRRPPVSVEPPLRTTSTPPKKAPKSSTRGGV